MEFKIGALMAALTGTAAPSPARVRNTNSFLPDAFCATSGRGRPRSHKKSTIQLKLTHYPDGPRLCDRDAPPATAGGTDLIPSPMSTRPTLVQQEPDSVCLSVTFSVTCLRPLFQYLKKPSLLSIPWDGIPLDKRARRDCPPSRAKQKGEP